MSRSKGVNKSKIRSVLSDCVFAPTEPGPMRIIADVGSVDYYKRRACEVLTQETNVEDLRFAIRLLVLATAELELKAPVSTS